MSAIKFKMIYAVAIAAIVSAAMSDAGGQSPIGIVEHIEAGHVNTVRQPDSLARLLLPPAPVAPVVPADSAEAGDQPSAMTKMVGYRVQVFSDNNPRTAKNEARTKQRSITSKCPDWRTYVTYTSPYWRLKVGDFRTRQEADAAAEELRRLFPAYSKEIRVVRDRVNVSN